MNMKLLETLAEYFLPVYLIVAKNINLHILEMSSMLLIKRDAKQS